MAKNPGVYAPDGSMYITLTDGLGNVTAFDKTVVGLSNVDNTSDVNKPVSTAQATALSNKVLHSQVFTAPGTFTTPAGSTAATIYKYRMVGGGGGGGGVGASATLPSKSGGGGEYAEGTFTSIAASTGIAITIGAAGTAGSTAGTNGGDGGTTGIGSPVSINAGGGGGGGGVTASSAAFGGAGGSAGSGTAGLRIAGGAAQAPAILVTNSVVPPGGSSILGIGGLGNSPGYGTGGFAGSGYGAGGGGTNGASAAGGVGTAGIVIIEWVL